MPRYEQGSGQNIDWLLISSIIPISPDDSTTSKRMYEFLRHFISRKSEILIEDLNRRISFIDASEYFNKGVQDDRIYQILFGLADYSNGWTLDTLVEDFNKETRRQFYDIASDDIIIDLYNSVEDGFSIYSQVDPGLYSHIKNSLQLTFIFPTMFEGKDGDIWLYVNNKRVDLVIKIGFKWFLLNEYLNSIGQTLVIGGGQDGDYWLNIENFICYRNNDLVNPIIELTDNGFIVDGNVKDMFYLGEKSSIVYGDAIIFTIDDTALSGGPILLREGELVRIYRNNCQEENFVASTTTLIFKDGIDVEESVICDGAVEFSLTEVPDYTVIEVNENYIVDIDENLFLAVDTNTEIEIDLQSQVQFQKVVIKDSVGLADINPITIRSNDLIDGEEEIILNIANKVSITVQFIDSTWYII